MKDRLTIGQMSALISNTGISTYVSGYEDVIYRDEVETSTHYGVRLSKLSTNYRNDILFDNVYYISLILNASSAMVGANIDIDITIDNYVGKKYDNEEWIEKHFYSLLGAFSDSRYIRARGGGIFLIYRCL